MFSNFFIESRLGETRLIRFVVTMATIRNNIHKYITMKFLSEFKRQFCYIGNGIKVISVHMKNRGKCRLRDIRAVGARTAFKIIRREPSRITSHSVLSPNGSMSITLVAIPAGMPAVPRCRPTVFYKPRREKAPSGLVYVLFLFGYSCLNSLFVQVLFYLGRATEGRVKGGARAPRGSRRPPARRRR